jgi:general stress protein 26
MDPQGIMHELTKMIEDAKTAVLATSGKDRVPHMRWVTPAVLRSHPQSIFMVTSPHFAKVLQVTQNPNVEWMFQTRALDRILNVCGTMQQVDNVALRSEVLEDVAPRLRTFWDVNLDRHAITVLETIITRATYFIPSKANKETVVFE